MFLLELSNQGTEQLILFLQDVKIWIQGRENTPISCGFRDSEQFIQTLFGGIKKVSLLMFWTLFEQISSRYVIWHENHKNVFNYMLSLCSLVNDQF